MCVFGGTGNFINLESEFFFFNLKHFQCGPRPKEFSRKIQVLQCGIPLKHSKFIKAF